LARIESRRVPHSAHRRLLVLSVIQKIRNSIGVCYTGPSLGGMGHGPTSMRCFERCGARAVDGIVADRNRPGKHVERARIVLASADRDLFGRLLRAGRGTNSLPRRAGSQTIAL